MSKYPQLAISDKYLAIYPTSAQDRTGLRVYTVPMYKKAILNSIKIELGSANQDLALVTYFEQHLTGFRVIDLCDYAVQ